jgi:tRNA (mo5U34)-methyltransferase
VNEALLAQVRARAWFYEFELPDGTRTRSNLPPGVEAIHTTRRAMLDAVLNHAFGRDCAGRSALDLACNQGWFAMHLARRGFDPVLAVDARASHLDDTRLMAEVQGAGAVRTARVDLEEARAGDLGRHDLVLMFGLLYHLENPVRALRLARAATRGVFVIETQVVPDVQGTIDWGSEQFRRPLQGIFGMVDETAETHAGEASTRGICLAPSIAGLEWVLRKVGFATVTRVMPPPGGYEQLVRQRRAMFVATA